MNSISAKAGGGGRTLEFEEGLPEDIPMERIQSFFDNFDIFGSNLVESQVTYDLDVAALTAASAKAKARSFVRAKNPFEPGFIMTSSPKKLDDMGVMGLRNAYNVRVTIQK